MKTKAFLASAAIFGAALFSASPASAFPVYVETGNGLSGSALDATVLLDENQDGDFADSGDVSYHGYFGSFDLTVDGNNFVAFCLDLLDHINPPNTYPYAVTSSPFDDNPIASGAIDQIEKYVDANYGDVDTNTEYAAFQLGLWELVYDGPISGAQSPDQHFNEGYLQATGDTGDGSVIKTALKFLESVFGPNPSDTYVVTYLDSPTGAQPGDKQDLMVIQTRSDNIPLVPLPAAGWLLGGGLISLFGFGRLGGRARRAAA